MSIVKSFSVGNGDMFYIYHNSNNFTVIDCCLNDDDRRDKIIEEIKQKSQDKIIHRFISTHPDEDHIRGLEKLDEEWKIRNFYCVDNKTMKLIALISIVNCEILISHSIFMKDALANG